MGNSHNYNENISESKLELSMGIVVASFSRFLQIVIVIGGDVMA